MRYLIILIFIILCIGCRKEVIFDETMKYLSDNSQDRILLGDNNTKKNRDLLFQSATNFAAIGDYHNFIRTSEKLHRRATRALDTLYQVRALGYMGYYHHYHSKNYRKAYTLYVAANELSSSLPLEVRPNFKFFIGRIQSINGQHLAAEVNLWSALRHAKNKNDLVNQIEILMALSEITEYHKDVDKMINYSLKCLDLVQMLEKSPNSLDDYYEITLNNLGVGYAYKGNEIKADSLFTIALTSLSSPEHNPQLYAKLLDNAGSLSLNHQQSQSIRLFEKAANIRSIHGVEQGVDYNKLLLSKYFLKNGCIEDAIVCGISALNMARKKGAQMDIIICLKNMIEIDSTQSQKYFVEYYHKYDSLQVAERSITNRFASVEYESEEAITEKRRIDFYTWSIIGGSSGIFFIGILLLVDVVQKHRRSDSIQKNSSARISEEAITSLLDTEIEIESARQDMRKKIGMDLHDDVMNRLASARLNFLDSTTSVDCDHLEQVEKLIKIIDVVEEDIILLAHQIESAEEHITLSETIKNILSRFIKSHLIAVELKIDEDWSQLSQKSRQQLKYIIQEAVFNIQKYANAKKIKITTFRDDYGFNLILNDNGHGFDITANHSGIGLANMRSRTQRCGGSFRIQSQTSGFTGTTISVTLPA